MTLIDYSVFDLQLNFGVSYKSSNQFAKTTAPNKKKLKALIEIPDKVWSEVIQLDKDIIYTEGSKAYPRFFK